jgi:hypothetical protein
VNQHNAQIQPTGSRTHWNTIQLQDGRVLVFVGIQIVDEDAMFLWVSDDGLTVHWIPMLTTQGRRVGYLTVCYVDQRPALQDLAVVGAAFFHDDTRVRLVRSEPEMLGLMEATQGWRVTELAASLARGRATPVTWSASSNGPPHRVTQEHKAR